MNIDKIPHILLGFLQATTLVLYIAIISFFFMSNTLFYENTSVYFAPVVILLLFVFSAAFTAAIVLGRAGYLFWEKQYRESFSLLAWTLGWIFMYICTLITILALFNSPSYY